MFLCIVLIWDSWGATHYNNLYMCTHWRVCLHVCSALLWTAAAVFAVRVKPGRLCPGTATAREAARGWILEGRLVGNTGPADVLPSALQQVATGSLWLQTSSNSDLDKWSKTTPRCWKEQLQWFIFPDLLFMFDLKVSIRIQDSKISLIMKEGEKWGDEFCQE